MTIREIVQFTAFSKGTEFIDYDTHEGIIDLDTQIQDIVHMYHEEEIIKLSNGHCMVQYHLVVLIRVKRKEYNNE